jgi:hypothetical protein
VISKVFVIKDLLAVDILKMGRMGKQKSNARPPRRNEYDAKTPENQWENSFPRLVRA